MKYVDTSSVYKTIRECYSIHATPRLIAEWNYNRLRNAWTGNVPSDSSYGQDVEMFPHESMAQGMRPGKGIIKARVGEGRIAWDYFDDPTSLNKSHGQGDRYYVAGVGDIYKYWSSPAPSNGSGNWPNDPDGTSLTAWPWVDYPEPVRTNKIVIGLENTWASPLNYTIWVEGTRPIDGSPSGNWTQIASQSNTTIDSEGRIILYYDGSWFGVDPNAAGREPGGTRVTAARELGEMPHEAWTAGTAWGPFDSISGVQLRVSQMDAPDSYLNVIEISPRLERDLSPYLMSVEDTFDMGDYSQTHPIGKASSNIASATLFNGTMLFNNDNVNGMFYDMLYANVKVTMHYIFDNMDGSTTAVPQFEMYSDLWAGQADEQVVLDLRDASKFLQEIKPRRVMYEKYTVAEIVWSICDSIGFDKYQIQKVDEDNEHSVDIFWTDAEKTAWEIFSELCEHSQTAIYFDGRGYLQIKTRKAAFNSSLDPSWELYGGDPVTGKTPDIVSIAKTNQYEANHVTVQYQQTNWPEWNRGFPVQQIVWEPNQDNSPGANEDDSDEADSGTLVLRATALGKTLNRDDTFLWIEQKDAKLWPYEGIVNVEGEFIRYNGKQYRYQLEGNQQRTKTINSKNELRQTREQTPMFKRHKNKFTGALRITQRGVWNTEAKRHFVDVKGWNAHSYRNGDRKVNAKGFRHFKRLSKVRLHTGKKWDNKDWLLVTRGESDDAGYYHYGTRMQIVKGNRKGTAGFVFHNNGTNEAGYYVDIMSSDQLNGPMRNKRDEVVLYVRKDDGSIKTLGRGPIAVVKGRWFDIDIDFKKDQGPNNDHIVEIAVNGWTAINTYVSGDNKATWGGKFGMFVRGEQFAEYEYVYAVNREEPPRTDESEFFFDRVGGGFTSSQWDREWIFNMRKRKDDRITKKDNDKDRERVRGRFFDEFGPIVHEMREFHVWFDPYPVKTANLFVSNDNQIFCPEYRSDNFTADFVLTNASRDNAVANGDDTLSFAGAGDSVNQRTLIFGQVPIIKPVENIVSKNEESISQNGKIEAEITSPWIQSKDDAQKIADWIRDHWAGTADELTATVFGNPMFDLGDVVSIESPQHNLQAGKHKYYVTSTSTTFDGGLETNLVLRRVRPSFGELT